MIEGFVEHRRSQVTTARTGGGTHSSDSLTGLRGNRFTAGERIVTEEREGDYRSGWGKTIPRNFSIIIDISSNHHTIRPKATTVQYTAATEALSFTGQAGRLVGKKSYKNELFVLTELCRDQCHG